MTIYLKNKNISQFFTFNMFFFYFQLNMGLQDLQNHPFYIHVIYILHVSTFLKIVYFSF